jgi:hypothetical protein
MRKLFAALFLFLLPLMASPGQVRSVSDIPGAAGGPIDTEVLQYDDGTYQWLAWQGVYRGTWFNPEDFFPGNPGFLLEMMEWWLYENQANPWDTSDIYASIWLGDQNGPQVLLDSRLITGGCTYYDPPLPIEGQFWGIVNCTQGQNVTLSVFGDGTPGEHSFFSDDFMVWESWGDVGDYMIRAHGSCEMPFGATTWGSLKALF